MILHILMVQFDIPMNKNRLFLYKLHTLLPTKIVRSNIDLHKSQYFPKLNYKHQLASLLISLNIPIVNDNLGPTHNHVFMCSINGVDDGNL